MSKPIYASMTKPVNVIEEGKYGAICNQIIQLGSQHFEKNGKGWYSPQVLVGFEIPSLTFETKDGEVLSQIKSGTYFLSLNPSRNGAFGLRELIDGFRGNKEWTEEELEKFDIASYLGKACILEIASVESKGVTYSNIVGLTAVAGAEMLMEAKRPQILITVDDFKDLALLETLPLWIQDKIRDSKEYKELPVQAPAAMSLGEEEKEEIKIEDIPF